MPAGLSRLGDGAEQLGNAQVVVQDSGLDGGDLSELVGNRRVQLRQLGFHRLQTRLSHTASTHITPLSDTGGSVAERFRPSTS